MVTPNTRIGLSSKKKTPKKQLGVDVSIPDWKRVVAESLRLKMPITKMILGWITPHLRELEKAEKRRKKE